MNIILFKKGETTMAKVKISINTDEKTKIKASELFEDLGMDMTTAINIFLKKAIEYQGIPFDVRKEEPNDETIAAIEEADKLAYDPNTIKYTNMEDLITEFNAL